MHAIPQQNERISALVQENRALSLAPPEELILRQNAQGTIFAASSASWSFFGVGERKLQGLKLTDLVAPRCHSVLLQAMADALKFRVAEVTIDLKQGAAYKKAQLRIRALRGGGFRTAMVAVAGDTEVVEEKPSAPLPGIGTDQIADVSHEIRTPLNAVIGFADALRQESFGPLGDHRYRDYAKLIQESGQHVLSLVNDLLDLSKAESDKLTVEAVDLDVAELVKRCAEMMQLEAERAGLSLRVEVSPRLGAMRLDPKIVRQILLNLLSNAVKFTDEGDITIRARQLDQNLVVSVQDSGVGMSKEDLERVGERFYQARQQGVRGARGSGLGLALSQALAKAHGGRLDLSSTPGQGTTATLTLPTAPRIRRYQPIAERSLPVDPWETRLQA